FFILFITIYDNSIPKIDIIKKPTICKIYDIVIPIIKLSPSIIRLEIVILIIINNILYEKKIRNLKDFLIISRLLLISSIRYLSIKNERIRFENQEIKITIPKISYKIMLK
ncbi:MAG: hypothetical protein KGD57_03945, partial [Candidatus Lokiarchaeota archaeon]|nr:hypothetical protein [Candidatus Lokiarchaeota archaeon]